MMRFWVLGSFVVLCACSSSGSSGGGASDAAVGGQSATGGTSGTGATGGVAGTGTGGTGGTGGLAGGSGDAGSEPRIEIVTSMGTMVIELDQTRMPITTTNFLSYVDAGFFDGTIIHRVIPDFVIQGGGFTPGMSQKATQPPIVLETHPDILHDYGVISMARTTDPDSATSQFFLVNAAAGAHGLDGDYAAFGRMIEGDATLDAISQVPTHTVSVYEDVPVTDVVVNSVKRL